MNTNTHKIVWLASYPKSGNTWFRIFLSNLLGKRETPIDINELDGGPIASSRISFDEATGLSSSDLTPQEIENLRPEVYRYIAAQSDQLVFQKIHDAFTYTSEGNTLIPEDATYGVLYFIRNPLDVAVSFAHHSNISNSKVIQQMNDDSFTFCNRTDKLHRQLSQKLLSWSNHIRSWVDQSNLPLMTIRFEDMKTKPFETFKNAISFLKLDYTDAEIAQAIQFSDFSILKKQEEKNGFKEKSPGSIQFFRKGIIGSWKEELTPEEITTITIQHKEMMIRFGYV